MSGGKEYKFFVSGGELNLNDTPSGLCRLENGFKIMVQLSAECSFRVHGQTYSLSA